MRNRLAVLFLGFAGMALAQGITPGGGGGGGGTGTVTSVGLSLPSIFTITNSPVSTSGTLTGTFVNQSPNLVFAGPSSGGSAAPTFRSLVAADIPSTVRTRAFGVTFDGGGSALTSGVTKYLTVPFACTIAAYNIAVDTGTTTIKTWKIATGTAIPTVANSISTSGVSVSSGTAIHSATVSDFTSTTVTANDIFGFNLFAVASATQVNFILECGQ